MNDEDVKRIKDEWLKTPEGIAYVKGSADKDARWIQKMRRRFSPGPVNENMVHTRIPWTDRSITPIVNEVSEDREVVAVIVDGEAYEKARKEKKERESE